MYTKVKFAELLARKWRINFSNHLTIWQRIDKCTMCEPNVIRHAHFLSSKSRSIYHFSAIFVIFYLKDSYIKSLAKFIK